MFLQSVLNVDLELLKPIPFLLSSDLCFCSTLSKKLLTYLSNLHKTHLNPLNFSLLTANMHRVVNKEYRTKEKCCCSSMIHLQFTLELSHGRLLTNRNCRSDELRPSP